MTAVIVGSGPKVLVDVKVGDEVITATDGHPFFVVGEGWVEAEDLEVGDRLADSGSRMIAVDRVRTYELDYRVVYNLTVHGIHTYHVGESRVLVHNCSDRAYSIATHGMEHLDDIPGVDDFDDLARYVDEIIQTPGTPAGNKRTAWFDPIDDEGARGIITIMDEGGSSPGTVMVGSRDYYLRQVGQ